MAYSELVKNFEKVRRYMRDFYLFGFKSRLGYTAKSARSYDDERRRIESWLGDCMRFSQTPEGKQVFLSIDSRRIPHNPFYRAWKAKSFTDGDITLHFLLFDILHAPEISLPLSEIMEALDHALSCFELPMTFDESTVRKKLKEYEKEGLILVQKIGRRSYYSRSESVDLSGFSDSLHFFSEIAPCGVLGSFLLDKLPPSTSPFTFRHHHHTPALDADILAVLFTAMRQKRCITAVNHVRGSLSDTATVCLVPLRLYFSAQNGRHSLLSYSISSGRFRSYRPDYLEQVTLGAPYGDFDVRKEQLLALEPYLWGVSIPADTSKTERVEFEIEVKKEEAFVVDRLYRERRNGTVSQIDDSHYRFTAEVFDSLELVPWIRTFLGRITRLTISNPEVEARFWADLDAMRRLYRKGVPL